MTSNKIIMYYNMIEKNKVTKKYCSV